MNKQEEIPKIPSDKYISTEKIKITITPEFDQQMTYYHSKVGKIEWCCILFYKINGNINDPKNLEIVPMYGHMVDIGSLAYTSANLNENFIEGIEIFEKLYNVEYDNDVYRIGMLHTHHTMDTFFSSTDLDELYENSDKHLYYLSLIVNFEGVYSAKICVRGSLEEKSSITTKTNYKLDLSDLKSCLLIFDCAITRNILQDITQNVQKLLDNKKSINNIGFNLEMPFYKNTNNNYYNSNFKKTNIPNYFIKRWNYNRNDYDLINPSCKKDYYDNSINSWVFCESTYSITKSNEKQKLISSSFKDKSKQTSLFNESKIPVEEFNPKINNFHHILKNTIGQASLIRGGIKNVKTISDLCSWMDINCKDSELKDEYTLFSEKFIEKLIKNCKEYLESTNKNQDKKNQDENENFKSYFSIAMNIIHILRTYRNYYYSVDDIIDKFDESAKEMIDKFSGKFDYIDRELKNQKQNFINRKILEMGASDEYYLRNGFDDDSYAYLD